MKQVIMMKFKKLFEEQKSSLLYSYKLINEDFTLNKEDLADESDLTCSTQEQGIRVQLRTREALYIRKIDEALSKIQSGTFGTCECCEEEIELSRLEVRPTANLCISCKESEEMHETRSADGRKSKSMGFKSNLRIA